MKSLFEDKDLAPTWEVRQFTDYPGWASVMTADGFFTICSARKDHAQLLAAAPDLLAALQEAIAVIERIKPDENGNGTLIRARAALTKATGEKA